MKGDTKKKNLMKESQMTKKKNYEETNMDRKQIEQNKVQDFLRQYRYIKRLRLKPI